MNRRSILSRAVAGFAAMTVGRLAQPRAAVSAPSQPAASPTGSRQPVDPDSGRGLYEVTKAGHVVGLIGQTAAGDVAFEVAIAWSYYRPEKVNDHMRVLLDRLDPPDDDQ